MMLQLASIPGQIIVQNFFAVAFQLPPPPRVFGQKRPQESCHRGALTFRRRRRVGGLFFGGLCLEPFVR